MSDFLKGLVVASLEEIENGDGAPAEAVSDEVIEAIEAAITAVNEAHDEVVASSSDVEKLEDIANALQETLVVAQESLVDGVLPAYAQQFMTVSLRHAYRRIGLESETETVNETPATDEAAAPVVAEVADTVPVAEGGTDATEHGPGVPEVEPATPADAAVPETGTAEPIATEPVESHGTTEAPVVPESNSMSMESFGDNVKAFFAALIKALKEAWAKVKVLFKSLFAAQSQLQSALDTSEKILKQCSYKGTVSTKGLDAADFASAEAGFEDTLKNLKTFARFSDEHLTSGADAGTLFKQIGEQVTWLKGEGAAKDLDVKDLLKSVAAAKKISKTISGSQSMLDAIAEIIDGLEAHDVNVKEGSDIAKYRALMQKQTTGMRAGQKQLSDIARISVIRVRQLVSAVKSIGGKTDKSDK